MASTYTWILQCLMKATDNITPKAFWTDLESGLINAASQIFPTTPHFYSKAYMPFQFNSNIQSTQNVESFNGIIKRSLNSASTLCDIAKTIDK
ncbi:hypothetical protein RhiirA4_481628 [Rhizophagus irregularis]|uniref:MULE transposase domain-containing protein n=1 Tax=Rhizophagus irregularis TaxID=588596 RepID=A0A2I1HJV1_9GLOM|nr:hypothetical protein RhiirA4_481628 [Rhizophagus irregularis]